MTDKERLDLMMSTNLAGIIKDDFLKWLGENGFSTLLQARSTTAIMREVCSTIPLW